MNHPPVSVKVCTTSVVGLSHHAYPLHINAITCGSRLEFFAEPENPHDNEAVAVFFEGDKIGYLPRVLPSKRLIHDLAAANASIVGIVLMHDHAAPLSSSEPKTFQVLTNTANQAKSVPISRLFIQVRLDIEG